MEVTITGHHMNISDATQNYVRKRLKKVEHHFQHPAKINVTLHRENATCYSEATIHGRKFTFHAKSDAHDMHTAIDAMSSKLDRQLIKHKEKLTSQGRHSQMQKTVWK